MTQYQKRRRGNAMIVGLTLIPVLGFGALSVDIGLQRMTSLQIQSAAEAGSLAGSALLNGTVEGIAAAEAYALVIANANQVYGDDSFAAEDVEAGVVANGVFTAYTNQEPGTVNAVRVSDGRTVNAVLAAGAFGITTLGAEGAATSIQARGGVPAFVDCYLPIAMPACMFHAADAADGELDNVVNTNPDPVFIRVNGGSDTGGWGAPPSAINGGGAPSNTLVMDIFKSGCADNTASTSETIQNNNGALADVRSSIAVVINDDNPVPTSGPFPREAFSSYDADGPAGEDVPISWPLARGVGIVQASPNNGGDSPIDDGSPPWGRTVAGAVPIVHVPGTDANNCSGFSWTGGYQIVGWTYGYVFDVKLGAVGGIFVQADFLNSYDIGYGQCVENPNTAWDDCAGNVTGTLPSTLVL